MQPNTSIIVLNSSSPDSITFSTPTQSITIPSSPTLTTTPCPPFILPTLSSPEDTRPESSDSNELDVIELNDTSFLEEELPELSLPNVFQPSSLSQNYTQTSSSSLHTDSLDCLEVFSQPELTSLLPNKRKKLTLRNLQAKVTDKKKRALEIKKNERIHQRLQKIRELEQKKRYNNVNKNRSKSDCSQELVFLFHPSFASEFQGPENLFEKLKNSKLEFKFDASIPPYSIACDRTIDRTFNKSLHAWEPLVPHQVVRENRIFLYFRLNDLHDFVSNDPDALITLTEEYKHKIVVVESEKEACKVTRDTSHLDPWLDLVHNWRIQHGLIILEPKSRSETVKLLHSLLFELGAVPYLRSIYQEGPYFTELHVKSGHGLSDTYRQFLMCIRSMSESTANAIMRHYPTIHRLYLAYLSDANNAPHLLENIMVDREQSSRKIGSALSKRIHSIFMSNDPLYEPYS